MDFRYRAEERLKKAPQYDAVFEGGFRLRGRLLTCVAMPTDLPHSRLGIIASRRVGGAVKRNRAKRLMREAFRLNKHRLDGPHDIVLIASPKLDGVALGDVETEMQDFFRRINEGIATR